MLNSMLVEFDEFWEIPLFQRPLCRFRVDSELKIDFLEPEIEEIIIIVKGECHLVTKDATYEMDAEKPTTLGPIFALYRKSVKSAKAFKRDGRLELEFFDDYQLLVPPDKNQNYESWEIRGEHFQVVCMPSGKLALWLPNSGKMEGSVH